MHAVIRQALGHAVRQNIIPRNIALDAKPPRVRKAEMITVDTDGAARLLDTARETDLYPLIVLTLATGLRRSEVLGLQWRDIDSTVPSSASNAVWTCSRAGSPSTNGQNPQHHAGLWPCRRPLA